VTRDPSAERPPPGWARTPSAFRSRGTSAFPLGGASGAPPITGPPGPSLRDALTRLGGAVRITALLLFLAPLLELVLLLYPPAPGDAIWRLAIAQALPGALMVPAAGALVLAVLAVARPTPWPSALALGACALGASLAGFALGVLTSEALPFQPLPQATAAGVAWPIAQATLTIAVFGVIGWGAFRHGYFGSTGYRGAALPTPRPIGIDLLD
jgi:hypothetical protein